MERSDIPAFPSLNAVCTGLDSDGGERWDTEPSGGMMLRDYFAAKAMQSMVSTWDETKPWPCGIDPTNDNNDTHPMSLARVAYIIAEAMIVERGQ